MNFLPLALLSLFVSGCATVTNLTPSRLPRNPDGLYHFEVAWNSQQRALRKDTIKAYVVIDFDSYPMQPTQIVQNRWETLVPIPANTKYVNYRYKWDFDYDAIPVPQKSSKLSPTYRLEILDR